MADERNTPLNQMTDKILQITSEGVVETWNGDKADLSEELKDKASLSGEETISNKAIENSDIGMESPGHANFKSGMMVDSGDSTFLAKLITLVNQGRGSSIRLAFPDPYDQSQTQLGGTLIAQMRSNSNNTALAIRMWRVSGTFGQGLFFDEIGSQRNVSSGGSTPSWGSPSSPSNGVIEVAHSWAFTGTMIISYQGHVINQG